MKIERPYIPLPVRVQVAERQLEVATGCVCTDEHGVPLSSAKTPLRKRLEAALFHLSSLGTKKLELHHRPALENRERRIVTKIFRGKPRDVMVFKPDANDPDYLFYIEAADHKVETFVRGLRGQLSDAGLRRKNKKMAKNRQKNKRPKHKLRSRNTFAQGRKLESRNNLRKTTKC